jgi:pimeloyl-ACP methyl ester carboxylesterase
MMRLLGGNYLRVAGSSPLPAEPWTVNAGACTLTGLQWDGPSPALVLLHGVGNNAWSWARVAGLMRGKRRVIAVNARGHGASSSPPRGYSLQETAAEVATAIERMAGEPVHLGGHSWGGKLACFLAASRPELVRSLSLADPVPPAGLNGVLRVMPWIIDTALRAERGPYPDRQAWLAGGRRVPFLQTWDEVDQLLWAASFEQQEDGSFHQKLADSAFEEILAGPIPADISAMLPSLACPVLLLQPTFTVSFAPFELAALKKSVGTLRVARVTGDHTFIHTNPLDTARLIGEYLHACDRDEPSRSDAASNGGK